LICRAKDERKGDQLFNAGDREDVGTSSGADDDWESSDSEDEDGQQILLEQNRTEDPFDSHSSRLITQEVMLFCFQQVSACLFLPFQERRARPVRVQDCEPGSHVCMGGG
jgi:hypothetical protein